ncbi:MAG TPA: TonB-dependent receptor, partial [Longimicrobiales bacterium]|nr:TonB-dependent receptor [Longimicrobiales bacterium]
VEAAASRDRARFEQLGGATVRELDLPELRAVPGLAEADPVRAIEVLPGVVSTSDFSAAFHVRGGSADQNLILLDGVPIFSPFHLGGLFSVFNTDMIERVELQSGGFAAEHGGRVSSVLEVESDPGESGFSGAAAISLLASRASVGGLLPDGAAEGLGFSSMRYRVSARRSYFDVLLKPAFDFPYHLTDLQGLVEAWTPGGSRLSISAYTGRDVLDLTRLDEEDFPLRIDWDWGNDAAGVRWTRPRAGGGSLDVRASFSRFATGLAFPDFSDTELLSRIQQAQLRTDFDTRPSSRLAIQTGASVERMSYRNRFATGGTEFSSGRGEAWLLGAYAQARWSEPARWLIELGLRWDGYEPEPGSAVHEISPRVAVKRFFAGGDLAIKVAAGRYTQFLHSLRDEELPLGLDIWVLAGERAPHVVSDQLQVGIEGFRGEEWFWSVEAYARTFDGVVTFNPADDPNDDLDDMLGGEGLSYGLDLLLRRDAGAVTGWVAASFLKADRTFPDPLVAATPPPEITYPPVFDRRLDLDLVLRYPFFGGWEGGLRWNFGTGTPYTRALGAFAYYTPRMVDGGRLHWSGADDAELVREEAVQLERRNGSRLPAYHRLDLSLRKTFVKSWGTLTPYLNVLNVYNRRNPLFYFFEYDEDPAVRSGISMFPVLPTIGLEVTF